MTEIAPELATFVREAKPNSSDYYKTAQDRLRVSFNHPVSDTDAHLRFKVNVPRREDVAELLLDVFLEDDSTLDAGTLLAQMMKVNGPLYRNMTWNNVPAVAPGVAELEGVLSGRRVRFDVTDLHGALTLEDGSVSPWMSFRFRRRDAAGTSWFVGPNRGRYAPRLLLTTQPKEFDPTDLRPVGIVGILKPVFQWTAPLEVSHYRVQVDDLGGDFTAPLYDSGEVAATGQVRNTITHASATGPAWSGIPGGGASWRVSHQTVSGWSDWVEAEVSYVAKSAPVLLNPGATDADPTPPLVWDLPADSFQVLVTRDNRIVEDTGVLPGPATTYTPTKGARNPGETLRREVRWFDEYDRAISSGDLPWVSLVQDTTFEPSESVAPMDSSPTVYQVDGTPLVAIETSRTPLPDEVWFGWGDSEGTTTEDAGDLLHYDWTVPPNTDLEYAVAAVVNNERSVALTTALRTKVTDAWLVDAETGRGFVLAGTDGLEVTSGSVVVVNEPISAASLIRRTLVLRDEEGTVAGQITDWPGRTREQQYADALWLRERPERTLRLIVGDLNIPVACNIAKPVFDVQMSFHDRILHNVSFAFSHAGQDG